MSARSLVQKPSCLFKEKDFYLRNDVKLPIREEYPFVRARVCVCVRVCHSFVFAITKPFISLVEFHPTVVVVVK